MSACTVKSATVTGESSSFVSAPLAASCSTMRVTRRASETACIASIASRPRSRDVTMSSERSKAGRSCI